MFCLLHILAWFSWRSASPFFFLVLTFQSSYLEFSEWWFKIKTKIAGLISNDWGSPHLPLLLYLSNGTVNWCHLNLLLSVTKCEYQNNKSLITKKCINALKIILDLCFICIFYCNFDFLAFGCSPVVFQVAFNKYKDWIQALDSMKSWNFYATPASGAF